MKVNVEFNLDWIGDEDNIDDAVSRKIIQQASDKVGEKIITAIKNHVDSAMNEKIDDFLNKVLSEFLNRNIILTDKWGKEVARHENVVAMLETRFDEFITESVDAQGKTAKDRGCRIDGVPRIDYLAKSHINAKLKELETQIGKDIDTYFKEKVEMAKKSLQKATIEKYMKVINFEAAVKL